MARICEIDQPFGLGDILLCEPIARHYHSLGYEILYWVKDDYIWIQDYIPYINYKKVSDGYTSKTEVVMTDDYVCLPLMQKAVSPRHEWVETGWLYDKYVISNLHPILWKTFTFDRNYKRENELYDKLGLGGQEYILVNSNSSSGRRDLNISSQYQVVNFDFLPGFNMLDWYKVMMNAKELHMVSTSTVMPALHMNHKDVTVYGRGDGNDTFLPIRKVFEDYNIKYEN